LLVTITESYRHFAKECLLSGADGIFFATKWAHSDQMTWNEYTEFGKRYEIEILEDLNKNDALIILHVCGAHTFLHRCWISVTFLVTIFTPKVLRTNKVATSTGKFVLGGIDPERLIHDADAVIADCEK